MAQQGQWRLGNAGMQIPLAAWHSGLRTWHCHSCILSHNCGSELIPGPGVPYTVRWTKKNNNNKIIIIMTMRRAHFIYIAHNHMLSTVLVLWMQPPQ